MNINSPIRLTPAYMYRIWGGRKLVTDYNKDCDLDKVGESWELSTHKDGSSIICGGDFDGMLFSDYVEKYKEQVLGKNALAFDYFPLLIKFIDANDKLSIQVHPDDEYAKIHEGEYGKTEMWYILDCEDDACIYYGFKNEITKEEFMRRIADNTLEEMLNRVSVKKGDVFFIESGTVHAINSGIMICEIQQNSNTTYRVYDYARTDKNGCTRELHIEKAADVSVLAPAKPQTEFSDPETLAECKYFTVKKADVNGERSFSVDESCFCSVIVTEGSGSLSMNGVCFDIKKGDSLFIPAQNGSFNVSGQCELILSRV